MSSWKAGCVVVLAGTTLGCAGVALRPDGRPGPEDCPPGAVELMRDLEIPFQGPGGVAEADATQEDLTPARLMEGPVVGYLSRAYGQLPERTKLYGRVWVAKKEAVIRYYEAQLSDGRRLPVCIIAEEIMKGLKRQPGSPPGVAIVQDNLVPLKAVESFP